jgi:hypothetical protein
MLGKNVTTSDVAYALGRCNVHSAYDGNLRFKRLEDTPRGVQFTIMVHASDKPGARRSYHGRRIAAACWHAHRDLLAALFDMCPDAIISTGARRNDGKRTVYVRQAGFFRDFPETGHVNIGSMFEVCEYQDACDCAESLKTWQRHVAVAR